MTAEKISTVSKILSYQILLVIMVAVIFVLLQGWQEAKSSALGGMAAFIPNLYLALKIQKNKSSDARKILNNFYTGEAVKLIVTLALFMLIFQMQSIMIMPLLIGYISALSIFWFALLLR
ncbi:MAG: ATP synthase subunit I [Methylococcaceae bacterium]